MRDWRDECRGVLGPLLDSGMGATTVPRLAIGAPAFRITQSNSPIQAQVAATIDISHSARGKGSHRMRSKRGQAAEGALLASHLDGSNK